MILFNCDICCEEWVLIVSDCRAPYVWDIGEEVVQNHDHSILLEVLSECDANVEPHAHVRLQSPMFYVSSIFWYISEQLQSEEAPPADEAEGLDIKVRDFFLYVSFCSISIVSLLFQGM